MARQKKQPANQSAWGDRSSESQSLGRIPDEVPRARTLAAKKTLRFRLTRWLVWACVLSVPVFGLMSMNTVQQINSVAQEIRNIPSPQSVNSPGKAAAMVEMARWLSMNPQPLLGGQVISWDGFTDVKRPAQTDKEKKASPLPDYNFEEHLFTLVDAGGNLFSSSVLIAVGPDSVGALPFGTPSLLAVPPTGSLSVTMPWLGFQRASAGQPVSNSITAWAEAFTSGDPARLRLSTGDTEGGNSYMPLTGVANVSAKVINAAYIPPANTEDYVPGAETPNMIAQVELTIDWVGAPELDQGESNRTTITYDVLLQKANTASPVVVAWGGPGSGPSLKPFQNALVGNDVKMDKNKPLVPKPSDDEDGEEGDVATPAPSATEGPDVPITDNKTKKDGN